MSFLDTESVAIHGIDLARWACFRVTDPRQVQATLRELCRGGVPLTLGAAGGPSIIGVLWSIDEMNGRLRFTTAAPGLCALTAVPRLWAAGYLREVKVQFELRGFAAEAGAMAASARAPQALISLPRRRSVRVRRAAAHSPVLRLRHPSGADRIVEMRVLDISTSGCSLLKPADAPPLAPGAVWHEVEVHLGEAQRFVTDLRIEHLSAHASTPRGARVGCAWLGLAADAAETLQRWINRGRRRRELVSLSSD